MVHQAFVTTIALLYSAGRALASPVVVEPSGQWHGNDGEFATFKLSVGSSGQEVQVLPDPGRSSVVVVGNQACLTNPNDLSCGNTRGGVFDKSKSTSWHSVSSEEWDASEMTYRPPRHFNLHSGLRKIDSPHRRKNQTGTAFGYDKISGSGWEIPDQGIMSVSGQYPYIGRLGLFTHYGGSAKNPISMFDNLRSSRKLRSASWSYTAGSKAENIPPSLMFGGYDLSRFDTQTTLTAIQRHPHERFEIKLKAISVDGANSSIPHGRSYIGLGTQKAELDFSRSTLDFPDALCDIISEDFGIPWNEKSAKYVVSEAKHQELLQNEASMSFVLQGSQGPQRIFRIPYAALVFTETPKRSFLRSSATASSTTNTNKDLSHKNTAIHHALPRFHAQEPSQSSNKVSVDRRDELASERTFLPRRYLAMRRTGTNSFNLGRAFLQHIYITAEFNRPSGSYLYLSQAKHTPGAEPQLHDLNPNRFMLHRPHGDDRLSIALPIALVCGSVFIVVLYMLWARRVGWTPFKSKKGGSGSGSAARSGTAGGDDAADADADKPVELQEAREWPADRKRREQEGEDMEDYDVPVYTPRKQRGRPDEFDDAYLQADLGEGSSGSGSGGGVALPPRYSVLIKDDELRKAKATNNEGRAV